MSEKPQVPAGRVDWRDVRPRKLYRLPPEHYEKMSEEQLRKELEFVLDDRSDILLENERLRQRLWRYVTGNVRPDDPWGGLK